ncbi:MAG: deoxyguanosinetriphosphate triphosphohydrolase [Candidatus Methylomirabilis sp.]|nr:deoxyguanosinetriphosphate triphosphohydrolase [Deltaproteobacteria bacterium]
MLTRALQEDEERRRLAPYAMLSADSRGRVHPESEHPLRTCFQRDRDRIVHSNAFRRLEYKTQVFVYHEGDYYRNRLTHTIEVAQITRTIARALRINEELAETVALAHDLGHTAFGHSGEWALDELMRPHGGFEHNHQSLRVVDALEDRYDAFRGLNLSWEVREGIIKHASDYDRARYASFEPALAPTLEAQIVDHCDEIAYNNHDIDDGLKSGLLDPEELTEVRLWRDALSKARETAGNLPFKDLKNRALRTNLNALVTDFIEHTHGEVERRGIRTAEDVRRQGGSIAGFSAETAARVRELKEFLHGKRYQHWRVVRMSEKAGRIIKGLFEAYEANPKQIPPEAYRGLAYESRYRLIADYIAGMTDRFAIAEYAKLYDPTERV